MYNHITTAQCLLYKVHDMPCLIVSVEVPANTAGLSFSPALFAYKCILKTSVMAFY